MHVLRILAIGLSLSFSWPARAGLVIVPDQAELAFDELGLYRVGYQLRGEPAVDLPAGWIGGLDSPTGAACQPAGVQNGREAWLMHCPWRGKTGVTFQEFTVALPPRVARITLQGATALRLSAVGKSDGVTYRIFVNGQKRFETNRTDAAWQPFEVDLSALADTTATIRFETDPGPRDDASFDFSLWGERRLEIPGLTAHEVHRPEPPALDLSRLISRQNGSVAPLSGFPDRTTVSVTGEKAVLRYQGPDGSLEYDWEPVSHAATSLLGDLVLHAAMAGDSPVELPLGTQTSLDWTAAATPTGCALAAGPPAVDGESTAKLTRTYTIGGRTATVSVRAALQGKSLVLDVACDQPVVRALAGGGWGPVMRRRSINVPYYSQPIEFLPEQNLFAGSFLDWTRSQASSHDGTRALYDPLMDGRRNLLQERLIYTAAWHLDETFPNLPAAPSAYRTELAGRVLLDIWGGTFAGIQTQLRTWAASGLSPAVALIHCWQFGGYDNELPQHVPANAALGGDAALAALVREAKQDGILLALHENYSDYYPNTPGFNARNIALAGGGVRVPAWFNPSTKIQSFAVRPAQVVALAKTQGPEILRRYGTKASFIDVDSAVPPWFHVDFAVEQPGAGRFQETWEAHRALWAYERELHGGPVFGEGNQHWRWSGDLDGVEAQFGQGWPDAQGTTAPLLADFDLLKIHPLQLNHGMGYYERWWPHGPDSTRELLGLLDQYRMQEAAYGHEGFLGGEQWHEPAPGWLESHLLPPLTARSALAQPVAIDYRFGDRWLDASATVRANAGWSQVRVRYDDGLTVWANGDKQPLAVSDEFTLPPNGWLARGDGLTAGTILRQGIVCDLAKTADSVFVNARSALDREEPRGIRIRPAVTGFTPLKPRLFRVSYAWTVEQTLQENLLCFVHFVPAGAHPADDDIAWQQDHPLPAPTSRWRPGQTVQDGPWEIRAPPNIAPGDYRWTIGLYHQAGARVDLLGPADAMHRHIIGTLHVATDGAVSFTPLQPETRGAAPANGSAPVVDFGSIRTDGGVFVHREGADWVLRPYPVDGAFTVELAAARFGQPAAFPAKDGWWRLPLTGAPVYRWPAND